MLKDLQKQLKKLDNQMSWMREFDAPAIDIKELQEERNKVIFQIMKICRGEY